MALDECVPYPGEYDMQRQSSEMTTRWAKKCPGVETGQTANGEAGPRRLADWPDSPTSMLFGIVQGATSSMCARQARRQLSILILDGYAIGGVSVGEPEEEMMRAVEWAEPFLPANKSALRDGAWYAAATAGVDRARDGHV
jgi:queuine tRNA-ribosyltransferase